MATGLQKFGIVLERENKTFSSGETVVGQVIVGLGKTKSIRGIIIRFKGTGGTLLRGAKGMKYRGHEEYFKLQSYLLGGSDNGNVEISSGYHVFPFNFTLPHNIPSSFEHKYGNIRYKMKAIIDKAWKVDHETSQPLTVEALCDPTENSASTIAINDEEHKGFCCFPFCFDMGSMNVNINIPTIGYGVGETIEAQITVDNDSASVEVTHVVLRLKQKLTIMANVKTRKEIKTVRFVEKGAPFNKKDKIMMRMQVPAVPSSTFPNTKLFDVSYRLEVQIFLSGCHSPLERTYPIVIGRIPVLTSQPVQNIAVIPSGVHAPCSFPSMEPTAPFESEDPTIPFPQSVSDDPIPAEATDSTTEIPPPSYDDCMRNHAKD